MSSFSLNLLHTHTHKSSKWASCVVWGRGRNILSLTHGRGEAEGRRKEEGRKVGGRERGREWEGGNWIKLCNNYTSWTCHQRSSLERRQGGFHISLHLIPYFRAGGFTFNQAQVFILNYTLLKQQEQLAHGVRKTFTKSASANTAAPCELAQLHE